MSSSAVSVHGVSYHYGSFQALDQVSFDVAHGAFFGLLGPNGSGKTTLFRILSTLMPPEEGVCKVFGHDTTSASSNVRASISMIFQQPSLDEELTVRENLTFHGRMYGMPARQLRERITVLAEKMGVADRLDDRVKKLSGGLKRRADIVRGVLHKPRVLFLDEPTTALDPAARHGFWQLLHTLRQEENLTLILATHLLEEAEQCDEVVILDAGRVAVAGNPSTLREELGNQMLWLASQEAEKLGASIADAYAFPVQTLDNAVCLSDPKAIEALPAFYAAFPELIDSATIRKPTLEDVFLTTTGHQYLAQLD
ncbi:MAG: ABC transporter ATP-binding protein [Bacteroidota bacterium]